MGCLGQVTSEPERPIICGASLTAFTEQAEDRRHKKEALGFIAVAALIQQRQAGGLHPVATVFEPEFSEASYGVRPGRCHCSTKEASLTF